MSNLFDRVRWATTGARTAPTTAEQQLGWTPGEVPPASLMNGIQGPVSDWVDNLQGSSASYADLASFIASAEPGDTGLVRGYAGNVEPLGQINATDRHGGAAVTSIDTDGRRVLVCYSTATPMVEVQTRSGSAILDASEQINLSGTPTTLARAITNGSHYAVAYDTSVDVFSVTEGATPADPLTVTLVGTATIPTFAADIAMDSTHVYAVGGPVSGQNVFAIPLSAPTTTTWTISHGASLNAVATDGIRVYVGGNTGTGTNNIRALNASSGAEIWVNPGITTIVGRGTLATDGEILYVRAGSNSYILSAKFGTLIETEAATSGQGQIALTPRYIFFREDNSLFYADRRHSSLFGGNLLSHPHAIQHGGVINFVHSDGERIYLGGVLAGGATMRIHRMPQLNDRIWRRVAPTDRFQPMRGLAFPTG